MTSTTARAPRPRAETSVRVTTRTITTLPALERELNDGLLQQWRTVAAADPLRQRLAVMPAWVGQQLEDLSGLLGESPERAKTEFRRLALAVTMTPVHRDELPRPFYRATVAAALPCLAGIRDLSATAVDRSDPRSDGSRPWRFDVDLPANQPGPGWRRVG